MCFKFTMLILLQIGAMLIEQMNASEAIDGKLEKLQIEGTVRNVDETALDSNSKFNSYWARLNWGSRIGWTEDSKKNKWDRLQDRDSINSYNEEDVVYKRSRNAPETLQDSEVELIDSSRISDEFANLRFMRLEKKIKKDI